MAITFKGHWWPSSARKAQYSKGSTIFQEQCHQLGTRCSNTQACVYTFYI